MLLGMLLDAPELLPPLELGDVGLARHAGGENQMLRTQGYLVARAIDRDGPFLRRRIEAGGSRLGLLDPAPQRFPALAHGTTQPARAAQVWLTGGDVDTIDDPTPILVVKGTATDASGAARPFSGTLTLGENRRATGGDVPGAYPICKQRIVSPIPTDLVVAETGGLLLRLDPAALFTNVDFAQLPASGDAFAFSDDPTSADYGQPSINLYLNVRAAGALYRFSWASQL